MQSKKKTVAVKKPTVKKRSNKISSEQADTVNTTKQRTFATIEQTFEFQDHKTSTRTTHHTSRRDCLEKMQANKLSPFSSPSHSVSPRNCQIFSPIVVKQKQVKKGKKSQAVELVNLGKKVAVNSGKGGKSNKSKSKNMQKVKAEFENQFLKRMNKFEQFNEKKITELSQQEMQASIKKNSKPILAFIKRQPVPKSKKSKAEIVRQMHMKVKQKYSKTYPNLKTHQLRLLCSIVLMQRLWRQTKVKMMICQFLSPRNSSATDSYNTAFARATKTRALNLSEVRQNGQNPENSRNQRLYISLSPRSAISSLKQEQDKSNLQNLSSIENQVSHLQVTPQKSETINLKDLEVSDQLSSTMQKAKAKQILKYIDIYREVTLKCKKQKKKKNSQKPNAFNFPESLSQKCLLQNLYRKRISNIKCLNQDGKSDQIDIFLPSRSTERSKQQYASPKKPEIVELQQRFYTQAQDQQYPCAHKTIEREPVKPQEQTVGTIGSVANKIIEFLLNQFAEQFQAFTSKKCLKKKKRLPGIVINDATISKYFQYFFDYVGVQHGSHLVQSFTMIKADSFLKIFRVMPQEDIFEPGDEEDEQQLNTPVLPNSFFFQFQPIYEQKLFSIRQQDRKYSNFLSGLIKIHNKCLIDCLSQFLQKQRIESIFLPWDNPQPSVPSTIAARMPKILSQIQQTIIAVSNTRLGRLHKRDAEMEEISLLRSLREDYGREGKDWGEHQERLEIRLELSEMVMGELVMELVGEMMH